MRRRATVLIGLFLWTMSAAANAQEAGATGWRRLFDGKTTAGWTGFTKDAFPEKGWVIEPDGSLHHQKGAGGGDIVTTADFEDFEFRFEWKVAPGSNSGVMYRVLNSGNAPWASGPEYQVLDDALHPDGKKPETSAASLYALKVAEKKTLRPVGDWNEGRIVVRDGQVEHWLNGLRVLSYEWQGAEIKQLVAASKFKDMPLFMTAPKGRIALQDHGDDVWFRNLRVREFKKNPWIALWNGKDFSGWTAHLENGGKLEDVWSVQPEGHFVCKGRPIGYLRTTGDYKNFILQVEWRFNPVTHEEGNSGVLLRMIGPDKVWPRSIEAQLQSRNAGDFWNIDQFPMKVDQSRTNGRNTKKLQFAENPVGEWNTYEIECCGGFVELKVNGRVLNDAYDALETPGKICLQSEGAEIQFRTVRILPIAEAGPAVPALDDAALPKWHSGRVGAKDLGKFSIDLDGAEELWLVVDPWTDGNSCDWADWAEATLTAADGSTARLVDLDWTQARAGWGSVQKNKNANGGALRIGGRKVEHGIGTHAPSLIGYRLDKKWKTFSGVVGIDDGGASQNADTPSAEFTIYTQRPNRAMLYR